MIQIGNRLKALRTARGFSPEEVAEKLGISKSTYVRYERNESTPDINFFETVAQLYEISIQDLLSEEKIILNFKQKGGVSNNGSSTGHTINQLSEKLIEHLEKRIQEKDILIEEKDKIIIHLNEKIKLLEDKL